MFCSPFLLQIFLQTWDAMLQRQYLENSNSPFLFHSYLFGVRATLIINKKD